LLSEAPIIDLLNRRFDDQGHMIMQLKLDMLRELQEVKVQNKEHETEDQDRFSSIAKELSRLAEVQARVKWTIAGGTTVALTAITCIMKAIEYITR